MWKSTMHQNRDGEIEDFNNPHNAQLGVKTKKWPLTINS